MANDWAPANTLQVEMDKLRDALINSEAGQEQPTSPRKGSGPRERAPINSSPASKGIALAVAQIRKLLSAQFKPICIVFPAQRCLQLLHALCD